MHNPVTSVSFPHPIFVEYGMYAENRKEPRVGGRVKVNTLTQAEELRRVFKEQGFSVDIVYRLRYRLNTYYFTLEALEGLATLANDIISAASSYESDRPSFKGVPKKIAAD